MVDETYRQKLQAATFSNPLLGASEKLGFTNWIAAHHTNVRKMMVTGIFTRKASYSCQSKIDGQNKNTSAYGYRKSFSAAFAQKNYTPVACVAE